MDILLSESSQHIQSAGAGVAIGMTLDLFFPAFQQPAGGSASGVGRLALETLAQLIVAGALTAAYVSYVRRSTAAGGLTVASQVLFTAGFHLSQQGLFQKIQYLLGYVKSWFGNAVIGYSSPTMTGAGTNATASADPTAATVPSLSLESAGHDITQQVPASEDFTESF